MEVDLDNPEYPSGPYELQHDKTNKVACVPRKS